ncbi:rhomboid family intramembrane serine protease [Methylosinus sp. LW4]|uniref:rhomboid family intramembrane serine protease n=1 Tax=Methylosinus sp. LW4 TaxID=136993 RepID=UPI000363B06A|nr:rhomboid family intramembrane serine protease [Methylosinus sp. LW4]
MVLPLHDDAPLHYVRRPYVNWTLMAINIFVFVAVFSESFGDPLTVVRGFGLIPAVLFGRAELAHWIVTPGPEWTLLTSLFFHSGLGHLAGNMIFLYVFGDNVEDAMGSAGYLVFYLLCGVSAAMLFAVGAPLTITPLVGASGAISGVCAAFILLYPRSTIFGLVAGIIPIHAPASLFVGTWILFQLFNAFTDDQGQVGWWAHIGGILAGLILTPLFKRRDVQWFGPRPFHHGPWG